MCGRMTQTKKRVPEKHPLADVVNGAGLAPSYNIAPAQPVAVITQEAPDRVQFLSWGLPAMVHNRSQLLINARAETLLERPTYRPLLEAGKTCLILADGFYEWKNVAKNNRIPHRFLLQDEELFAIAGLYKTVIDRETGELQQHFTLITTEPNTLLSGIHDRMPAILPRHAERDWLKPQSSPQHYLPMLQPYDTALMQAYPVAREVSSPGNNYPELIRRADYPAQPEQLSLF
jgi:putative SOS response-associated peptidase YedK